MTINLVEAGGKILQLTEELNTSNNHVTSFGLIFFPDGNLHFHAIRLYKKKQLTIKKDLASTVEQYHAEILALKQQNSDHVKMLQQEYEQTSLLAKQAHDEATESHRQAHEEATEALRQILASSEEKLRASFEKLCELQFDVRKWQSNANELTEEVND